MKRIFTFISALTVVMLSWAETFTVGNFKYETLSNGTVSVAKSNVATTLSGDLIIPSSVSYEGTDYVVSKVAWGGFCDTGITTVILPITVTGISDEAFSDCPNLQKVSLPTNLTSIGRRAFYGCDALQAIESHVFFSASVDVNAKAFSDTQFSNVTLYVPTGSLSAYKSHEVWQKFSNIQEKDMEDVDNAMFNFTVTGDNTVSVAADENNKNRLQGSIVIPEEVSIDGKTYKVTSVAERGFYYCDKITSVTLPNTVIRIEGYAFQRCTKLENIVLSNTLSYIGEYSFYHTPISHIDLPESLETIERFSFADCLDLEDITIPKNVKTINEGVFVSCDALKDIKVDESNPNFISKDGMLLSTDGKTMYAYAFGYPATQLEIPETVIKLISYLFCANKKLSSVSVPSGVTNIGMGIFKDCTALTNVNLPDGITGFGWAAFYGCSSLKTIIFPQSLEIFSSYVFERCKSLESVVVRQFNPVEIPMDLFEETVYQNATLYVPIGRARFYKQIDCWAKFVNIEEMEMPDVETSDSPYDNIEENQMILGYYTSNDISNSGYGGEYAGRYKVCVRYTKEQMTPFAGNRITNIRFALVNTDIMGAKLWIGSTRDKKDLYEQSLTTLQEGWNEIVLQTPFDITGDSIFIGLEYKQSSSNYPISAVNMGTQDGSWYLYGPYNGSDEDEIWIKTRGGSFSIQCIVEGDHIPLYDLHTVRMSIKDKYMKAGEDYDGYLYMRSWGKKSVTSAKIVCEIDGKEVSESSISNIINNIQGSYITFRTDENLSTGLHTVTLRVKEINGEKPTFPVDDAQSADFKFYTQDMGRDKVLLELHTATWCGYTPSTHRRIEQMMEERDDIVLLSIHHSDEFSTDASDAYSVFTGSTPTTYYNRYAPYGATSLGYTDIDDAKLQPSMAKLQIAAEYIEDKHEVRITVKGEKNEEYDLLEGYANLTVLLTEDGIVNRQKDNNAGKYIYDYIHNGVIRTNASAVWGDPVTWNGNGFEMKYVVKLDADWVTDNMKVIAFLAKPFTGENYDEIGVVNCNDFALKDATHVTEVVELKEQRPKTFDVYSLSGIKLRSNVTSLVGLPEGMYVVDGEKVFVSK